MKLTLPTWLTLARIMAIPLMVVFFYLPHLATGHILAAILFSLASITDWLDGYLARVLKQTSAFGAFLDPVADKLLVATALVLIVSEPFVFHLAIPAAIIIGREIVISALRERMAELGKRASLAVTWIAKIKTSFQMVAVICLLAYYPGAYSWILVLGYVLIYLAAVMTLWSMLIYWRAAWVHLVLEDHE